MIRVEGLVCRAGSFRLDLSLEVDQGEYFALLGPTGSGKTLLLECLCGLRSLDAGRIEIAGADVTHAEPRERGIGYVPQEGALFPHLSVGRNIAFPMAAHGETRAGAVVRLADALGVAPLLDRRIAGLSGGEAQRVALARALAAQPKVLLLDEPVSALDEDTRNAILTELLRLHRETGLTTVHVCHNLHEMQRVADRTGILWNGRLLQAGRPEALRRAPADAPVARLLGLGTVLNGVARPDGVGGLIQLDGFALRVPPGPGGKVQVLLRSAEMRLSTAPKPGMPRGRVTALLWQNASACVEVLVGAVTLRVELPRREVEALQPSLGEECTVVIPPDALYVFE